MGTTAKLTDHCRQGEPAAKPEILERDRPNAFEKAEEVQIRGTKESKICETEEPQICRTEEPQICETQEPQICRTEEPQICRTEEPQICETQEPQICRTEKSKINGAEKAGTSTFVKTKENGMCGTKYAKIYETEKTGTGSAEALGTYYTDDILSGDPANDTERAAGQSLDNQMYMEQTEHKASYFKILCLPSLLYAVVYTLCMFQNSSGITMPVWIAAAVLYGGIVLKRLGYGTDEQGIFMKRAIEYMTERTGRISGQEKSISRQKLKKGSWIYIVIMLLLGISTCMTDHRVIIVFNYIGFFMILIAFLLHNFYDDSRWEFAKGMTEIAASVMGAVCCMLAPFCDGIAFYQLKRVKYNRGVQAVFIGLACAVPLLTVLGACLMDADAVFGSMMIRFFTGFRVPMHVMHVIAMLLFGFFSSYCGIRFLALGTRNADVAESRKFDPVIALTFTGCIACMYLAFSVIQVVYLFAGNMQLPEGMTYAEYAHDGFFQLLFVCAVNLCMVLLVRKYFLNHKVLNWMLILICGCTYIMIASSAYRMILYISTYQLTFLRILVLVVLALLAILMAGVFIFILNPVFPLFRYSMIIVSVIYLGFSFSHVDYFIASYNLSHAGENMDWWYLSGMSLDAAPAVADYYAEAPKELKTKMDLLVQQISKRYKNGYEASDLESTGYAMWDDEDQTTAGWYYIYMNRVFYAKKNMRLRNFNISRFLAVKRLLK
ncbi:MAG: DUF4173 domain-containing protein [Eubacterium sp.]|nr:DUF4173 domain-containing protein [Eubacterium sp.]